MTQTLAEESVLPRRHRVGERVRVKRLYPVGHVRTPYYCRGKTGTVERLCGAFPNPEELAYARSGLPAQPLYRVRFRMQDLWSDYTGSPADIIDIEIFQHWLETPEGEWTKQNPQ